MTKQIIKRAVVLFPRTDYTDPAAVRHARRQWMQAVNYLRSCDNGSKWLLDQKIERMH